jgi:hypothetical protein
LLDSVVQRNNLITGIERARNSALIAYMLHDNAVIADDAVPQIYDKLQAIHHRERLDVLLFTRGGVTEACWRLLGLMREYCDHLGVIVGTRVQGAGSLLALGADEIVMGPLSEVGGVEAIRNHPLLPRAESGQPIPVTLGEIKNLLKFLSEHSTEEPHLAPNDPEALAPDQWTQTAGSVPPQMLARLFEYVHPLAIASMQQSDTLSRALTRKALEMHMHPDDQIQVERLVELFNGGFHSPMYTMSRAETRDAGLPVTYAEDDLWTKVLELVGLYQAALYNDRPDPMTPGAAYRYVCMVESAGRTTGLRQTFSQADGQERVLQLRWETAVKGPGPGPSFGPGNISNN